MASTSDSLEASTINSSRTKAQGFRAKQTEEFSIIPVDTREFNFVFDKLSEFFKQRGFLSDCKQHVPTIMAACEDLPNMLTYNFRGKIWPMIQTNQMHLGTDKDLYAPTTSYRNEQHPIKGRHSRMFPMFEFESLGASKISLTSSRTSY